MIKFFLTLPNGVIARNRIVKSAMSEALGDSFNNPTDSLISLYGRWGKGGAGLLITGNTPVDRWHLEHAGNLVIDEFSDMNRLKQLTSAAKNHGALILAQLGHSGRQTPKSINPQPLSISDIPLDLPGYGLPRRATDTDFELVISQFAKSAALAEKAGFNGVQIHAAHGYLLSSSLSPRINTRDDHWGGTLKNRARLVLSVVRSVKAVTGEKFVIAVKLNSSDFQKGGFSHEDSVEVAKMLQGEGIDFLEISGGNFEMPVSYQYSSIKESTHSREAYFLDYAREIKAALSIPIMVTGGFRTVSLMESALADGSLDLIGMGRPFIADPDFPQKIFDESIKMAPALERNCPPANDLPRGAVLNWFCYQLSLCGAAGNPDISIPVIDGHKRYLENIKIITDRFLVTRSRHFSDLHQE